MKTLTEVWKSLEEKRAEGMALVTDALKSSKVGCCVRLCLLSS